MLNVSNMSYLAVLELFWVFLSVFGGFRVRGKVGRDDLILCWKVMMLL